MSTMVISAGRRRRSAASQFVATAALLAVSAAGAANADEAASPPRVSREVIAEAWGQREQKVKSAHFEWTEVRQSTKQLLMPGESRVEPDVPQYNVSSTLSLKGNQIRHTFRKEIWQTEAPRGENQYVSVSNKKDSKVYLPPGYITKYPRGHESRTSGSNDVDSVYVKPFLWCFRPSMDKVLTAPLEKFEITDERGAYFGRDCVVLRHRLAPSAEIELWLDPSRDYVIVRQQFLRDGHLVHQFDVDYQRDEAAQLWIPQDWRFAMLKNDTEPVYSMNGQLSRAEINPPIAESEFEFEFPPGTWVHGDHSHEHIVMADGRHRNVLQEERALPYETLQSETEPKRPKTWRNAWIGFNVSLFAAASLGLFVRRKRARRHR